MQTSQLDLRAFLAAIAGRGPGHYQVVSRQISPAWQMAALVTRLADRLRFPVLCFRDVEGTALPVVTNVCSSFERVAQTLDLSRQALEARLVGACDASIAPVVVDPAAAPVRHTVRQGRELDLGCLPQILYTEDQTAPYLTAAMIVGRDPDSGAHNLSFHRLILVAAHTAAIYMTPHGHLEQIWRKNRAANRATPVAAIIGSHPVWCYASLAAGALEQDDYGVLGAVLDARLELVPGIADDALLVPARAEIVLEGNIAIGEETEEGPFGEFLGYVAAPAKRPLVQFSSMSTRESPVYQDIVAGQVEHLALSSVSLQARLERKLRPANPGITAIWLPAPLTVFIAVDSERQPDFDAASVMGTLLSGERYVKQVIVFDANVELRKQSSVQHALACHVQADRDIVTLAGQRGNGIDPSERNGKTTKIGINAMAKGRSVANRLPQAVLDDLDLKRWLS